MQEPDKDARTSLFLLEEKLDLRYALLKKELASVRGQEGAPPELIAKFKEFEDLAKTVAGTARQIYGNIVAEEDAIKQQEVLQRIQKL